MTFEDHPNEFIAERQSDPFLAIDPAETNRFSLCKYFDEKFSFWSDIGHKVIILDGEGKEINILISEVVNVKLDINVKSLRKRPFYAFSFGLESTFFPTSKKITTWRAFFSLLLTYNDLQ